MLDIPGDNIAQSPRLRICCRSSHFRRLMRSSRVAVKSGVWYFPALAFIMKRHSCSTRHKPMYEFCAGDNSDETVCALLYLCSQDSKMVFKCRVWRQSVFKQSTAMYTNTYRMQRGTKSLTKLMQPLLWRSRNQT